MTAKLGRLQDAIYPRGADNFENFIWYAPIKFDLLCSFYKHSGDICYVTPYCPSA